MVKEVFASEETVALAKQKACEMLGAHEDDVEFEVIQFPEKKVFGMFGGKLAQVRATLKTTPGQKALEYLKEILYYMGLESVSAEISEETDEACDIKITGEDIGCIVGKHGETLDSLQYIVGLVANSKKSGSSFCKIRIEAGNYREKRKEILEELGKRIAKKALQTGRKINLEPMKAYERKIIHTAIDGMNEGVCSWSEGEGEHRHIVVAPKFDE